MSSIITNDPTKWSDSRKWWMDLLKSVIAFGVGVVLTFSIINRFDERRLERRFQSQLQHNLMVQAADSFRQATLEYDDAAQDAYLEMARISSSTVPGPTVSPRRYNEERTIPIRRYEDDAWVAFRVSLEGVRLRFPANQEVTGCLEQLEENNKTRHLLYQEAWADWISGATAQERWAAGARNRPKYDELLEDFLRIRSKCIQALERSLTSSHSE